MKKFHKTNIKSMDSTGMLTASSKFLIKKVLKYVDFSRDIFIVEFGSGDGCVTEMLLDRMSPNSRLFSYELLPEFYEHCLNAYGSDPRFKIFNHSAEKFQEDIAAEGVSGVDAYISSLPLTLMPSQVKDNILSRAHDSMRSDGIYLQYQYSFLEWPRLKRHFKDIKLDFALLNVPPAIIYRCTRG